MEQAIALNGVGNARQLGGYRIGNRRVRDGVLLRTAGLDRIAPEAAEALQNQYHLQTVVDLRMSMEREQLPDPDIPGARNLHLPVVEMEDMLAAIPGGVDPKLMAVFNDPNHDRMEMFNMAYENGFMNDQIYVGFLLDARGRTAYRAFFQALLGLEEDRAILWHCTDGKDRTGCAAMLTLFALGADRETVYHDYLLTNAYNARMIEAIRQRVAPYGFPVDKLNALLVMCGAVAEAYMNNALDALDREYGGVQRYLSEALGVGPEETACLCRKFLTD